MLKTADYGNQMVPFFTFVFVSITLRDGSKNGIAMIYNRVSYLCVLLGVL